MLTPPHRYDPLRTLDIDAADWQTERCDLFFSLSHARSTPKPPPRPLRSSLGFSPDLVPFRAIRRSDPPLLRSSRSSRSRSSTTATLDPAVVLSLLKRCRPPGSSHAERLPGALGHAASELLQRAIGIKALVLCEVGVTMGRQGRSAEALQARACGWQGLAARNGKVTSRRS